MTVITNRAHHTVLVRPWPAQNSLQQVVALFQRGLHVADKSVLQKQRIINIIGTVTRLVVSFVSLGLFERHKLCFKVLVLLKILQSVGKIGQDVVFALLRGGAAAGIATSPTSSAVAKRIPSWITSKVPMRRRPRACLLEQGRLGWRCRECAASWFCVGYARSGRTLLASPARCPSSSRFLKV